METRNVAPPAPVTLEDVQREIEDLRGLLNQDLEKAAPILRELLGEITIVPIEEGEKQVWTAHLSGNVVPLLAGIMMGSLN
jgi:hypothetical protein